MATMTINEELELGRVYHRQCSWLFVTPRYASPETIRAIEVAKLAAANARALIERDGEAFLPVLLAEIESSAARLTPA